MSGAPPNAPSPLKPQAGGLKKSWWQAPEASVLLVILLVVLFMFVTGQPEKAGTKGIWENFRGTDNIDNLLRSIGLQSIFAVGELLVIITGGIDLSVGSLIAFDGMIMGKVMTSMVNGGASVGTATAVGIVVVLAFSISLGLGHAALIHYLKLPPFVVTLASMSILRTGALIVNDQLPITLQQFDLISYLGNKKLFIAGTGVGLPVPLLILLIVAAAVGLILIKTRIGRQVYAVGSNEEASRLSGVSVFKVRAFAYGSCSALAGVAAILFAGYSNQADPNAGPMFELNAVSAVVIGGAVLTGGRGTVIGTVLGAVLLELLLSVINFKVENANNWRGIIVGGVLLLAVTLNQLRLMWMARRAGKG